MDIELDIELRRRVVADDGAPTPVHAAAYSGDTAECVRLLQAGHDIATLDALGNTALHYAISDNNVACARVLIAAGASVRENHILPSALYNIDIEMVKLLIRSGADVNGNHLWPILHTVASIGHVECCQVLLDAGAHVNTTDQYNDSALHRGAYNGHYEICAMLLKAGAAIDVVDYCQQTPLFDAAKRQHTKICELLLDAGADPSVMYKYNDARTKDVAVARWLDKLILARAEVAEQRRIDDLFNGIKNAAHIS